MNAADRAWMQLNVVDKLDSILNLLTTGEVPAAALTQEEADSLLAARAPERTPTGRPKRVTEITDEFRQAMNTAIYKRTGETYTVELGGVDEVQHEIDKAVGRKAHLAYNDKQVDVRGWLKRAVGYREAHRPTAGTTYEEREEQERAKHEASLGRRVIGRVQE